MNTTVQVFQGWGSGALWRACLILLALAALLATSTPTRAGSIIHVVPGGAGTKTGDDWNNAQDLAAALSAAVSGDELWVKTGTYTPDTTGLSDAHTATFALKPGVAVYSGFAGGETVISQRDWRAHVTTLSGDLGTLGNACHVVTGSNSDSTGILDGFTISGGKADGHGEGFKQSGGGIYNDGGSGMFNWSGSPTLTNVTFDGNSAVTSGGGMYTYQGSPTLTNVTFSGNSTTGSFHDGGGMYNKTGSPKLTNVTFSANTADYGGGMRNDQGSPALTNVTFRGNHAFNGGGMYNDQSSPTLTNVTFSGNSASHQGGGMYNVLGSPAVRNSILWGDSGGEIYNDGSSLTVSYSIVQGSGGSAAWNSSVGTDGGHNLDADPLFITAVPSPAPSSGGDLQLQSGSPAINAGANSYVPTDVTTDLDGNTRSWAARWTWARTRCRTPRRRR